MNLDDYVNKMQKEIEAANKKEELQQIKKRIEDGKDPLHDWCTFLYDIYKTNISKDKIELLESLYNYIDSSKFERFDGFDASSITTKYHWYYFKGEPVYIQQIQSTDGSRMGVSISIRNIDSVTKEQIKKRVERARTYSKIGSQKFYCFVFSTGFGTGLDGAELYYSQDKKIYIKKKDIDIINNVNIDVIGNDLAKEVMILKGKQGQYTKHSGYTID